MRKKKGFELTRDNECADLVRRSGFIPKVSRVLGGYPVDHVHALKPKSTIPAKGLNHANNLLLQLFTENRRTSCTADTGPRHPASQPRNYPKPYALRCTLQLKDP